MKNANRYRRYANAKRTTGPGITSRPSLYFNTMIINEPKELTHIIKLWIDENNCGFWRINMVSYKTFDVIHLDHIYNAINWHDNEVITLKIIVPHDGHVALYSDSNLGSDVAVMPSDPNFFLYLRKHINHAILTAMGDLHKKLSQEQYLKYRGVYAKSS